MLSFDYIGTGCNVGDQGHVHRAMVITEDGVLVANGLDVTFPDGSIAIRVFNYHKQLKSEISKLFDVRGVKELTFTEPV